MTTFSKAALLLAALAAIFAFTYPAASETAVDIVVDTADTVRQETIAPDNHFDLWIGGAVVRVVTEYANSMRESSLLAPPPLLQAKIGQVETRPLVQYAEGMRQYTLAALPPVLGAQLGAIYQRIVMELAEGNRELVLQYPAEAIQDRQPPVISRPTTSGANLVWTTNEFVTSVVRYGATGYELGQAEFDQLYRKEHKTMLLGMGPGVTLYCQITSTDQSGNTSTSPVFQVSGTRYLYLPNLQR
jgi:hypothetical protein